MGRDKKELIVLTLLDEPSKEKFRKLDEDWASYFYVDQIFDSVDNIDKHLNKPVGIMFIEAQKLSKVTQAQYDKFKSVVPSFLVVAVKGKHETSESELFKNAADQIFYLDADDETLRWNSKAIMRRYLNIYSCPTTIKYKSLVIDYIDRKVKYNNREVFLTGKEFEVLKELVQNRGHYIKKKKLFEKVWGFDEDTTRVLDQILYKLKQKVGANYFHIKRNVGVKFA